jgi:prophage DNA circulation protein
MKGVVCMVDKKTQYHPILDAFIKVAPLLNDLFLEDILISVSDKENFLLSVPAKTFSLGIEPGFPLRKGDVVWEAVNYKRIEKGFIPEDVFGFPIIATAIPLYDEQGEIIGGVGVGVSMEQHNTLLGIASRLSEAVQQVAATIEELASSTIILSENMNQINEQSNHVLQSMKEIENVAKTVGHISKQSHVLGLNASIEAARAGEYGRGFSVVATEIQKMAKNSSDHTDKIRNSVHKVDELISRLDSSISNINAETEKQSAVTEELSATMQEISENASLLADIAKKTLGGETK